MPLFDDAQAIYAAAVRAVQAPAVLARFDPVTALGRSLDEVESVTVVGAGKAAMAMAGALEARFPSVRFDGSVTVPHGYPATFPATLPPPRRIRVRTAGHPVPDAASAAAAQEALDLATAARDDGLVLALLSGGGSALWTCPPASVPLDDLRALNRLLLASGLPIDQVNAVRKQVSKVSGGRLSATAHPTAVCALVLSDVIGDDLTAIASGPTVGTAATREDVRALLVRADLWDRLPTSIATHLRSNDTLPVAPDDTRLCATRTLLLGSNRDALAAALQEAASRGYAPEVVTERMDGEARDVGAAHAQLALARLGEAPLALLWGGEPTVTVTGSGRGGRNQEAALAAALVLDGAAAHAALLCAGTDGIDGPTDAAGAWAAPQTIATARRRGIDAKAHLTNNDAYAFFAALSRLGEPGGLLQPGPTHTNVMDLHVALVGAG